MDNTVNIVTLSTGSYNAIKGDNYRLNMLLDNLLLEATISADHSHLVFDSDAVDQIIKFCYPERYKKKLAAMRTQATKYGTGIEGM